jgi:ABC-type lipoprotein export system ATPase subunit
MANPTATVQNVCSGLSNVNVEDLAIIAVMGTTGSGKSTFIQKATDAQDVIIGHSYAACTNSIDIEI